MVLPGAGACAMTITSPALAAQAIPIHVRVVRFIVPSPITVSSAEAESPLRSIRNT